jgi:hypothetical protein
MIPEGMDATFIAAANDGGDSWSLKLMYIDCELSPFAQVGHMQQHRKLPILSHRAFRTFYAIWSL